MNTKRSSKFIEMLFMAGVAVIGFSTMLFAEPYQPNGIIRITTISLSGNTVSGSASVMEWSATFKASAQEGNTLSFVMADTEQEVCRLLLPGQSGQPSLTWNDNPRSIQVIRQPDLLVAPGAPVPCDLLPADMAAGAVVSRNYEVKREAAGQVFVDGYRVESSRMSAADARAKGWLKSDAPEELVMITMTSLRTGTLVVRQLWAPGEDWWRYEETPYRQSWINE